MGQYAWLYLPRYSPAVFAPAARAFLTAIPHYRVPITVRFFLIVRRNLERKRLALLEGRTTIETDTGNATNGELYRQHIPCLAVWKIRGRIKNGTYRALGERSSVKLRCSLRILFVPEANRILRLLAHYAPV